MTILFKNDMSYLYMLSKPSELPVWQTFQNKSYNCMPLTILTCILISITVAYVKKKKANHRGFFLISQFKLAKTYVTDNWDLAY